MAKKETQTTALAKWDEELAAAASEAAEQEAGVGGGQFFSIRGNVLKFGGSPFPGNQMAVVILDSIIENTFYDGGFDPDSPSSPSCYALGRDEKTLAPHGDAETPQNADCTSCPQNQFGSRATGKGKACKNGRRLALIPAGAIEGDEFTAIEDADEIAGQEVAYLRVPPTSIKAYATYVKNLFATQKRPPFGVYTRVYLDSNLEYPQVFFECLGAVPDEIVPTLMERNKAQKELTTFPYPKAGEGAEASAPKKAKPAAVRTQAKPAPVAAKAVVPKPAAVRTAPKAPAAVVAGASKPAAPAKQPPRKF